MKIWGVRSLVLLLVLAAIAAGQDTPKTEGAARKTLRIAGQMSDDGRWLLRDADGRVWTVSNPDALEGFAGREVVIRCQLVAEKNELRVVSVKAVKDEAAYAARWGDSAFRR